MSREARWTASNQQLVNALRAQYPQIKTGRQLLPDLRAAFPEAHDAPNKIQVIPDGYAIYPDERAVDIFEAEVTHPIPRSAMRGLAALWFWLDAFDIQLNLCVVSRYGHINLMDFLPEYLGLLQLERAERGNA